MSIVGKVQGRMLLCKGCNGTASESSISKESPEGCIKVNLLWLFRMIKGD